MQEAPEPEPQAQYLTMSGQLAATMPQPLRVVASSRLLRSGGLGGPTSTVFRPGSAPEAPVMRGEVRTAVPRILASPVSPRPRPEPHPVLGQEGRAVGTYKTIGLEQAKAFLAGTTAVIDAFERGTVVDEDVACVHELVRAWPDDPEQPVRRVHARLADFVSFAGAADVLELTASEYLSAEQAVACQKMIEGQSTGAMVYAGAAAAAGVAIWLLL